MDQIPSAHRLTFAGGNTYAVGLKIFFKRKTGLDTIRRSGGRRESAKHSTILLFVFLGSFFLPRMLSGETFGNFTYTDAGATITITDYPESAVGSVVIPSTIGGKPVTSIGDFAFQYCAGVTSVSIPSGVTSLGNSAFYQCTTLTNVAIPSSVTVIHPQAFSGCSALVTATLPGGVTTIGDRAFSGCRVLNFSVPASVTYIGNYAFSSCGKLTGQAIPSNVTFVGNGAFYGCSGLTGVTIPASLTAIAPGAFEGCSGLTSVTIPASITSIGSYAFSGCSGLSTVTIPSGVKSIGAYAFSSCAGMTAITVNPANPNFSSAGGVLFNKLQTSLIQAPAGISGFVTIPSTVTSIGTSAFDSCSRLTGVAIPASVTSIADYAFQGCTELSEVTIPPAVKSVSFGLFRGCTGLTSVTIPSGVTSIASWAFSGCRRLANLAIPDSLVSVDALSFDGCSGLISLSADEANPNLSSADGVLFNKLKTVLLMYPSGRSGSFAIPPGVTSVGSNAFSGCTGLTSVTIPPGVTSVGSNAFSDCTGLTSMTIPPGVTSVGSTAFVGCTGLTSMAIPASVTSIGSYAFMYCAALASISVDPANLNFSSADGVLYNKLKTALIQFPPGKSGSFLIPFSVTSIDPNAFLGCGALTSISVDAANPNFSSTDGVLFNKLKTTLLRYPSGKTGSLSIPSSVASLGPAAFEGCTGLTGVTIPSSVGYYAYAVFQGCSSLSSIEFLGNAPDLLPAGIFDGVPAAMIVKFHSGATGFTSPTWRGFTSLNLGAAPIRSIGVSDLLFGLVPVHSAADATLTISNTGDSFLTVSDITYPPGFTGAWPGGTIAPGSIKEVLVTFNPVLMADYNGTITVISDSTSGTGKSTASGQGGAPLNSFANWHGVRFSPGDIAAGLTVATSDFDSDGSPNLLEYAFGTDPKSAEASPIAVSGGESSLEISFPCDEGCPDTTYTVQSSSTLSPDSWSDIARSVGGATTVPVGSLSTVSDSGTGLRTVTVTDLSGAPSSGQRFLRVNVTLH